MELLLLIVLVSFACALKWLDCITTYNLVKSEDSFVSERNPIARFLMNKIGLVQTLVFVMGLHTTAAVALAASVLIGHWIGYTVVHIILGLVVINNLWQMKKAGLPFKTLLGRW